MADSARIVACFVSLACDACLSRLIEQATHLSIFIHSSRWILRMNEDQKRRRE